MQAIAIREPGGADVLVWHEMARPQPAAGQVLIRVKAAGVNRPDILQRQGGYPPPPGAPSTPGLEVAGSIIEVGEGCRRFKVGDDVCALVPGGGYAEYCVAAEDNCLPIPRGMTLVEAAGLPETYFTVWTNVFERGGLVAGETFLVHGGTSGIGSTAIQLAKAFGATVIATAGSDEKCEACRKLGADLAINYRSADFVEVLKGQSIAPNVILDMVGGSYVERNLRVAAMHCRIVQIAFQQGSRITADMMPIMLKRLYFTGSTLRPRSVAEKAVIARALEDKVWPLLAEGRCRPVIHATFPMAQAAEAHRLLETSTHVGKIILTT
ncbi:MAG: NAD(P)H-quinone oxidoreductase [Hyphomicrobiales bacterium]